MKIKCTHKELLPVGEVLLKQNPNNPNKHTKEQIQRLAKIIDFQGQRSVVIISNRSGKITKGHATLLAIEHLGWEKIAVDFQDYNTEAEEYAHMTSDNEIGRWSELNVDKFLEDIKTLDLGDIDLLGLKELPQLSIEDFVNGGEIDKLNHDEHWLDMPEFDQKDKNGFHSIIVNFENEDDYQEFAKLINQKLTPKTKSIWFPAQERMDTESRRYAEDDET
jgi:hypothetical protein